MEYKIISAADTDQLTIELNTLSKDEWDIVSVYATCVPGQIIHYACLKKAAVKKSLAE